MASSLADPMALLLDSFQPLMQLPKLHYRKMTQGSQLTTKASLERSISQQQALTSLLMHDQFNRNSSSGSGRPLSQPDVTMVVHRMASLRTPYDPMMTLLHADFIRHLRRTASSSSDRMRPADPKLALRLQLLSEPSQPRSLQLPRVYLSLWLHNMPSTMPILT